MDVNPQQYPPTFWLQSTVSFQVNGVSALSNPLSNVPPAALALLESGPAGHSIEPNIASNNSHILTFFIIISSSLYSYDKEHTGLMF